MPLFDIEAKGEALEHYGVEAESEEEAREKFERGDVGPAYYTEVSDSEIVKITESTA